MRLTRALQEPGDLLRRQTEFQQPFGLALKKYVIFYDPEFFTSDKMALSQEQLRVIFDIQIAGILVAPYFPEYGLAILPQRLRNLAHACAFLVLMRRMIPRSSNVSCLKGLRGGRDAPEDISIQCSQVPLQTKFADVNNLPYTQRMVLVTKTATIQVGVVTGREGGERARAMAYRPQHAIELFLRRVIVEERLPFEVIALNPTQIGSLSTLGSAREKSKGVGENEAAETDFDPDRTPKRRKKNLKTFLGVARLAGFKLEKAEKIWLTDIL